MVPIKHILCIIAIGISLFSCGRSVARNPSQLYTNIELVPVVIGDSVSKDVNAIGDTWELENFSMNSDGRIAGVLNIRIRDREWVSVFQDVLLIQIWGVYVHPMYDSEQSVPAREIIAVLASQSTNTTATFNIEEYFEVPSLITKNDGGSPLHRIRVSLVWYRLLYIDEQRLSAVMAKIGTPDVGDPPWHGIPLMNQVLTLTGNLDYRVGGNKDHLDWLRANIYLPTSTPIPYPAPINTPSPPPKQPYPPPTDLY